VTRINYQLSPWDQNLTEKSGRIVIVDRNTAKDLKKTMMMCIQMWITSLQEAEN